MHVCRSVFGKHSSANSSADTRREGTRTLVVRERTLPFSPPPAAPPEHDPPPLPPRAHTNIHTHN